MTLLIVAALVWLGVHIGIAGSSLRGVVAARLGENGFRAAFSVLSILTLVALILAYRHSPEYPIWFAPIWLRWVLVLVMLAACILFVGSVARPNPTAVRGDGALTRPAQGITRLTRHPMLWVFTLWASVHIVGNGDVASILFFGAFLLTALAGMPSIDAKIAARDPLRWRLLAETTSILPGGAILAGRNRLVLSEIGWLVPLAGFALWLVLLFGHSHVIGVAPVPGLPG